MERNISDIPLDLKIYKKSGAAQFTLIRPNRPSEASTRIKPGSLLIELSKPGDREKSYDWANKITIALNVTELGKFGLALEGKKTERAEDQGDFVLLAKFVHDPNISREGRGEEVKTLTLSAKRDSPVFFLNARSTTSIHKNISVPIGPDEAYVLREVTKRAIIRALGW